MAAGTEEKQPVPATQKDAKPTTSVPKDKKELKILMLHGYTQSGPLFSAKTKALHKLLLKALPSDLHPTLIFPSGPHRLRASDIPGYVPAGGDESLDGDEDELDNWAWFRKDEASGTYRGLAEGMQRIAQTIRDAGGVDGVLGFSQGGCMAALVTAALEHPYRSPSPSPSTNSSTTPSSHPSTSPDHESWLTSLRAANSSRPLRFSVIYSGFFAPPADLQWLYTPNITTPTLHFLGSLDTVVEEERSQALIRRCVDPVVLTHPGGHYVPVAKAWVLPLADWVRRRCVEEN
ncbi:serine hydrolase FSH [Nemania sp. FL0916]|nr:serine hydrolase FSH [Nemania sp. FL0916]